MLGLNTLFIGAQLSDDVFQNYVVSSTKLPSSEPIDNQANQFSQLATNAEPCLGSVGVLDDSDNGKDCSLQNFPNNYKKEVVSTVLFKARSVFYHLKKHLRVDV